MRPNADETSRIGSQSLTGDKSSSSLRAVVDTSGQSILVYFDEKRKSTYHAPWLWQNDSHNTMIPSGQKEFVSGLWTVGTMVLKASIRKQQHREPVACGGAGNGDGSSLKTMDDLSDLSLVVTWNRPINNAKGENEGDCDSIYNLSWLRKWAYDTNAANEARLEREVSVKHTFVHKHQQLLIKETDENETAKENRSGLLTTDYRQLMSDNSDGLLSFLDVSGGCCFKNIPLFCL